MLNENVKNDKRFSFVTHEQILTEFHSNRHEKYWNAPNNEKKKILISLIKMVVFQILNTYLKSQNESQSNRDSNQLTNLNKTKQS